MKLKPRILARTIRKAVRTFPAVVLTGPRQSGKTTLLKMLFGNTHTFASLEDPDIRIRAQEDPNAFLDQYHGPVVIDEIQYVPELFSYIKTRIDQNRKPGRWIMTGSQNFILMQNVTQSLAGRAAILSLLPFSIAECIDNADIALEPSKWLKWKKEEAGSISRISLADCLLRGFYPEIASHKKVDRQLWCGSYITTYLERDVRNLAAIGDISQYERFLIACAVRTGQILNLSEIARDIGVSVPTARRWLSMLETGYQVYLLYPYYRNIGKRTVKSPKLFFNDVALCSYMLGLNEPKTLVASPHFGQLFETMVVCDFLKRHLNAGMKPSMYYLRSRDGLEVDLVMEDAGRLHLFEIKAGKTITSKHASSLKRLADELGQDVSSAGIISCSQKNYAVAGKIFNYGWKNILDR